MKFSTLVSLVLMVSCVAGQDALQKCYNIANYLSGQNPPSTCAYIEDAVRCGIKDLGLTQDSATQAQIDDARSTSNGYFTGKSCSRTFDNVFSDVKAKPKLLVLQQCIDTALTKGQANPSKSCTFVDEAVRCGIKALSLDKDTASDQDLQFGKAMATRYLKPYSCSATFDSILESVKNSSPTMSPIGWLTAVMVAFIVMFTTV